MATIFQLNWFFHNKMANWAYKIEWDFADKITFITSICWCHCYIFLFLAINESAQHIRIQCFNRNLNWNKKFNMKLKWPIKSTDYIFSMSQFPNFFSKKSFEKKCVFLINYWNSLFARHIAIPKKMGISLYSFLLLILNYLTLFIS